MSDWIQDRMLGYYPEVIKDIYDIQAVIDGEYPEFKLLNEEYIESVQNNAYLLTMDESRITQWEELLSLQVIPGSTIEDRRDAVIARIRGNKKLNTESIQSIVSAFTNGKAVSWFADSFIHVEIKPPQGNKQYVFKNVENELEKRKPAHLGLSVTRKYSTWDNIKMEFDSWDSVKDDFATWDDVFYYVKTNDCNWNDIKKSYRQWQKIKSGFNNWKSLYFFK